MFYDHIHLADWHCVNSSPGAVIVFIHAFRTLTDWIVFQDLEDT